METDRNLLLGKLALQAGLIDTSQFVDACADWSSRKDRSIAEVLIERDLKVQNVILGDFGEVVVLDWGFAKRLSDSEPEFSTKTTEKTFKHTNVNLTMDGEAIGTPAYMAPEQASAKNDLIDTRTDVYGLRAMLYEVLTGKPPFSGEDMREVLLKVCNEDPVAPNRLNEEVPSRLEHTCLAALFTDSRGVGWGNVSGTASLSGQSRPWSLQSPRRRIF